ncbi:kinase-like domain-containing protein [Thelephora terrestris]|uniref:Kinase-like domain-containing protein n=1 Tax=Thelephora terrestris TaxID=56493 RepID=A0A9P6HA57_9AGAM|nr:kinase-like domain-containing protein [Thelephora terrestris]
MSANPERYRAFENRTPDEKHWATREELFNAHGYNFRPRLRKDWVPSWRNTGTPAVHRSPDSVLTASQTHLIDAYTDEGKCVCIKPVGRNDEESRIAQMLSTKELRSDPRNHCVPIIEIIDDPEDDTTSYMVMPLLRVADSPPFQYVKEIVDFVDQVLEGLVFIHEKGVAHRDCVMRNILMDADAMYPEGFHPVHYGYKRDYSGWATYFPRSVVGVRYYFADFGISTHISEEDPQKLVTGVLGRDQEPPELSELVPYDPFKLDVFIMGNMLRQDFYNKFANTGFLLPLISRMTAVDPEQRVTAKEALPLWLELREKIPIVQREWRPRPRFEHILETAAMDTMSLWNVSTQFALAVFEKLCGW